MKYDDFWLRNENLYILKSANSTLAAVHGLDMDHLHLRDVRIALQFVDDCVFVSNPSW